MDRDQKHGCKFCGMSFPCGRSLGGHMRRHVSSPASASPAADAAEVVESRAPGYGLRENRKKSWRLADLTAAGSAMDSSAAESKRCRECGKEFQSWRALFGHMSCHSGKLAKAGRRQQQQQEDEGSWSVGRSHKKRSRSRRPGPGPGPASSSTGSEGCYSKEQEDVAISLMMLSRDVGWHFDGSSERDSAASCKNDDEFEENSDESLRKKKEMIGFDSKLAIDSDRTRRGYECAHCNKRFHTFQALGGHRASHKRMRGCFGPIDQAVAGNGGGGHQCSVCGKVFGSGQALGGHKRSHLVMATPAAVGIRRVEEEDPIDLNLPAAAQTVGESSKGGVTIAAAGGDEYGSWWARSNLRHEGMISMIAN